MHDLKIWARALATGTLLSAATQKERLRFVDIGKKWLGKEAGYGLGIADFGGFIGHNGDLPGFQSWVGYNLQSGATIIVLTNLYQVAGGKGPADDLAMLIQHTLFA